MKRLALSMPWRNGRGNRITSFNAALIPSVNDLRVVQEEHPTSLILASEVSFQGLLHARLGNHVPF